MVYIVIASALGILILQALGAIPSSSVGGPMTIALAVFAGALAVAVYEAFSRKRGAGGWIANIGLSFIAAFLAAPIAGFAMVLLLTPFANGSSLAAAGGLVSAISLAGTMAITLTGSWGALQLVNRWRDASRSAS